MLPMDEVVKAALDSVPMNNGYIYYEDAREMLETVYRQAVSGGA